MKFFFGGIAAAAVAFFAAWHYFILQPDITFARHIATVKRMQEVGRYVTLDLHVETTVVASANTDGYVNDLLFSDKLTFNARGTAYAGSDLTKLKAEDVTIDGTSLTVRLPPTELFLVRLDNQTSEVIDRETAIFGYEDGLETQVRKDAELALAEGACANGILLEAVATTQNKFTTLLQVLKYDQVTVLIAPGTFCGLR